MLSKSKLFTSVEHNSFYSQCHNRHLQRRTPFHPATICAIISSSLQGKQEHYNLRLLLFTLPCLPTAVHATLSAHCCSQYLVCPLLFTLPCLPTAVHAPCLPTAVHATMCQSAVVHAIMCQSAAVHATKYLSTAVHATKCLSTTVHATVSACLLLFTNTKLHTPTTSETNNSLEGHVSLSAPQQAGTYVVRILCFWT